MEDIKFPDIKPGQGPVLMLNLIKFKDKRVYFEEYIPAFEEVVKQLGIDGVDVKVVSEVVANIIADDNDQWDEVVLVEYPSAEAFFSIAQSEVYHTIANPLRLAGTAELKLIMTRQINL
ncbi:hypothetical protein FPZ43_17565 [Mucilaginibacter pallidiroseus]|uniref:DUF1330 domain-containing protein n=1 Tax=Mucilaginibacter pallidiroseus TaxID=2599295 RepID=A0A563U010_9SPHI|nr:hypothetical protein [Mucilaginibacter pallidiroseus]TWR24710.1 hypothetical protein FPZ43_17565 [Mucilaginibacter pallidiroseus]